MAISLLDERSRRGQARIGGLRALGAGFAPWRSAA
jgi:hypothetical protein